MTLQIQWRLLATVKSWQSISDPAQRRNKIFTLNLFKLNLTVLLYVHILMFLGVHQPHPHSRRYFYFLSLPVLFYQEPNVIFEPCGV